MLVGGSILCVVGAAGGEQFSPTEYSMRAWGAWAFLVVVGSIIAFSAYAWLLQTTPVSVVSTYAYVSPVVAVFLGWMVLSEPVTTATIAAAAIIVSGVALVVSSELPGRKERR
jgi:drug/metabolite transporter (DMT)-like permease